MPNHITNELTAAEHVVCYLRSKSSVVDFETLIPMPDMLRGETDTGVLLWAEIAVGALSLADIEKSFSIDASAAFKAGDYGSASTRLRASNAVHSMRDGPFPKDFSDERFEALINAMRCLKKYGHSSWYEWSIANWGTKWNAYDVHSVSPTVVRFDTAWSSPGLVIAALSKRFPQERIRLRWASEDTGCNAGDVTFLNGEVVEGGRAENKSREAYALALDLRFDGVLPDYYRMKDDGTFEYAVEAEAAN